MPTFIAEDEGLGYEIASYKKTLIPKIIFHFLKKKKNQATRKNNHLLSLTTKDRLLGKEIETVR